MSRQKPLVSVGDHLRAVRTDRKLRQKDVATILGVSVFTLIGWEGGRSPLPKDGPAIVRWLGYLPLPRDTLPEQLYAIRFTYGLTQAEAGARVGVGEDAWREVEGGKRLSERTMAKIEPGVKALLDAVPGLGNDESA